MSIASLHSFFLQFTLMLILWPLSLVYSVDRCVIVRPLSSNISVIDLKEKGKYAITIELIDNAGKVISKNSYKIEVV